MKGKTKLISLMIGFCFVAIVGITCVFAVQTLSLNIGGKIKFNASGVNATITNSNLTGAMINNTGTMLQDVVFSTKIENPNLEAQKNSWIGLDMTMSDSGTAILSFRVTNTDEKANLEFSLKLSYTKFKNATIIAQAKDSSGQVTTSKLIAPSDYVTYEIIFAVTNKNIDAEIDDFIIENDLKHITSETYKATITHLYICYQELYMYKVDNGEWLPMSQIPVEIICSKISFGSIYATTERVGNSTVSSASANGPNNAPSTGGWMDINCSLGNQTIHSADASGDKTIYYTYTLTSDTSFELEYYIN